MKGENGGWETITVQDSDFEELLERLRVPGGWLYRSWSRGSEGSNVRVMAMAFVPDVAK